MAPSPDPPRVGALSAPLDRGPAAVAVWPGPFAERRGSVPATLEFIALNLRTRSVVFTAAIAALVLAVALVLVHKLVSVANDPQFARQIGWNLLLIGVSAGTLAAGAAWWVVRRITQPLQRLARTMSEMARDGELR